MARKRKNKNQSILTTALNRDWKFSASSATFVLISTLVIPGIISNRFLTPILQGLIPIGLMISGVFYLIALFKFFSSESDCQETLHKPQKEPYIASKSNSKSYTSNVEYDKTDLNISPEEKPSEWSLKLIKELEWKKFEELSTAYYIEKGIRAESTKLGSDGGIDIKLYQNVSEQATSIVQCKAWESKVGVQQIREFLGVMTHEKIPKGFYMTSSGFTEEAIATAKANQVTLINGEMLIMMIKRLNQESQLKLLSLATQGDYKTPSCSTCGTKMIRRKGKVKDFWGCSNFPRCKKTLKLRSVDV